MQIKHKRCLCKSAPTLVSACITAGQRRPGRLSSTFGEIGNNLDTVGRPESQCEEIKIADEAGGMKEADRSGEILIKGDMIMNGYWGKPGLTLTCFSDGWYSYRETPDFSIPMGNLHLMAEKRRY